MALDSMKEIFDRMEQELSLIHIFDLSAGCGILTTVKGEAKLFGPAVYNIMMFTL